MAHFNVEHSAQMSRDALAAAQQTAQGQQVAQESVRRTQRVQARMAAAEVRKVQRRSEDEEREHQRQRQDENRDSFSSVTLREPYGLWPAAPWTGSRASARAGAVSRRPSSRSRWSARPVKSMN